MLVHLSINYYLNAIIYGDNKKMNSNQIRSLESKSIIQRDNVTKKILIDIPKQLIIRFLSLPKKWKKNLFLNF